MKTSVPVLTLSLCALLYVGAGAAAEPAADLEATTAKGEKVLLHPNGRWEFVDTQKQAEAKKVAEQFPENKGCPPGWQGGLLGVGRCIPPGDKDYNRGSMGRR